jgi:hypothetical protein
MFFLVLLFIRFLTIWGTGIVLFSYDNLWPRNPAVWWNSNLSLDNFFIWDFKRPLWFSYIFLWPFSEFNFFNVAYNNQLVIWGDLDFWLCYINHEYLFINYNDLPDWLRYFVLNYNEVFNFVKYIILYHDYLKIKMTLFFILVYFFGIFHFFKFSFKIITKRYV